MEELIITSKDFDENGWISNTNSGYGEDKSPELKIEGISEKAVSIVITLDDIDHPLFPNYNHWVAWNIPAAEIIPGGLSMGETIETPVHACQGLAYGIHCYRGPKPPLNWLHRYRFTVYTLDKMLDISTDSKKEDVLNAIRENMLQEGILIAKYQKKHK